jgi:hypothetical protein
MPDPGFEFFHPGSQIPDPVSKKIPDPGIKKILDTESASKNISIFNPKKLFLSSRENDLGCSSRIPDLDPGSRGQKGTRSRIPDPQH